MFRCDLTQQGSALAALPSPECACGCGEPHNYTTFVMDHTAIRWLCDSQHSDRLNGARSLQHECAGSG